MLLGETSRIQKGCVYEGCVVQKSAGSKMDVLLLSLIDYPCPVEAVSLYEHQSRRGGIRGGKDYFDVQCTLHERITGGSLTSFLGRAHPELFELLIAD